MAMVAVLDFWLGLFRPRRSQGWLAVSIASFLLFFTGALALIMWLAGAVGELWHPESLQTHALAAAAAITWWSRLPLPAKGVERRFE